MTTPSQARLKAKEEWLEQYDRSRSRSAKRKMITPSQARLKERADEKKQWLEEYDYDRSRSRSAKKKSAKRKLKKVTRQSETEKVKRQSETKKAPRSLEEMCAAKKDYEIILMDDGTKSCRKRCVPPKPVRSSSQSRKCIAGTKGLEPPRVSPSHQSAKKAPRTLEETCAAKKDYEIIEMDDGTKSCRKRCEGTSKPHRSTSQGKKCIKGTKTTGTKGKTKKRKRRRAKKVKVDGDGDEDDDSSSDEDDDDDFLDNEEEEEDDNDDAYNYKDLEDYEEHKVAIEEEIAEAKKYNPAMKKMKDASKISKCLSMLSTEELKEEIQIRHAEAPNFEIIKENEPTEPIKYVDQVMGVTKNGKKRIQPMALAAIAKEKE